MAENPSVRIDIGANTGTTADQIIRIDGLLTRLNSTVRGLRAAGGEGAAGLAQVGRSGQQAAGEINKASTATSQLQQALKTVGTVAGGFIGVSALQSFGSEVVATAAKMDGIRRAFAVITGDSKSAADQFGFVTQTAKDLGLNLESTAAGFVKIAAAAKGTALEGQPTRDIFLAVSKAAASLGLSSDEAQGALLAISQMMSKGKVSAEELRGQLGERLPGAVSIMARALGVTTAQLDKMLQSGEVGIDALPKFAAELDKAFNPKTFDGVQANLNNLGTAWTEFKDKLGKGGIINPILGALQAQVEQASEDVGILEDLAKRIGGAFQSAGAGQQEQTRQQTATLRAQNQLAQQVADQKTRLTELTKQRETAALQAVAGTEQQTADARIKATQKLIDARRKDIDTLVESANKAKEAAAQAKAQADQIARDTKSKLAGVQDRPDQRASAEDALTAARRAALEGDNLDGLAQAQRAAETQLSPFAQNFYARGDATKSLRELSGELDKMKGVTDPKLAEQAATKIQDMAGAVQDLGSKLAEASDQTYFIKSAGDIAEQAQRQLATLQEAKSTEAITKAGDLTATVGQLEAQIDQLKAAAATIPIDVQIEGAQKKLADLQAQLDALPAQKTIAVDVGAAGQAPAPQAALAAGGYPRVSGRLPGYGGGDRIRALLEAGEFVVRKEATAHYGPALFSALNALAVPRMAQGGLAARAVASLPAPRASAAQALAPVHLHLPGMADSFAVQATGDVLADLQRAVGRLAIRRGRG